MKPQPPLRRFPPYGSEHQPRQFAADLAVALEYIAVQPLYECCYLRVLIPLFGRRVVAAIDAANPDRSY